MSFGHTLTNVASESRAQRLLEFAAFELHTQFIYGRDPELLICAKHALRVEPRIVTQSGKFRRSL